MILQIQFGDIDKSIFIDDAPTATIIINPTPSITITL